MSNKLKCPETGCELETQKLYNLKVHLQSVHKYSAAAIDNFSKKLKQDKGQTKGTGSYECSTCGDLFLSISGYNKHKRLKHPPDSSISATDPGNISLYDVTEEQHTEVAKPKFHAPLKAVVTTDTGNSHGRNAEIVCPDCNLTMNSQEQFCEHYSNSHAVPTDKELYKIENESFKDENCYQIWLEQKCRDTCTAFYTIASTHMGTTKYKRCRHVGKHESISTKRLGHASVKEVAACTAFLKVSVRAGQVSVAACFGHVVGHTRHPAALPLSILEKEKLSSFMESGIPHEVIINNVRNEAGEESRYHYTTTSDLRNIREKRGMHPGRKHNDDLESVRLRYEEEAYDDGIRLFSPPVDSSGKGFDLVIITPIQLEWIESYGHKGILMDDTHNTTRYGLHLTTMMVVDHLDRGLPCAFLLTSGASATDVEKMLLQVKNLVPTFDTSYVMTDEANAFWNAFVKVFPQTSAQKIICRYHVYMAWKKNVKEKMKGADVLSHAKVNKKLRQILRISEEKPFRKAAVDLFTFLNSNGFEEFSQYINTYYMSKIEEWATFSRKGVMAQTSMFCEAWHSRIKAAMGKQKGNMRIDQLLHLLITAVAVIKSNNFVNESRKLSKASSRAQATVAEHRRAVTLYSDSTYLITGNGSVFQVGSKSSENEYTVEKTDNCRCLQMNTHCPMCHACAFDWTCTCLQQRAGIICAHVHAVVMNLENDADDQLDDGPIVASSPLLPSQLSFLPRSAMINDNRKDLWVENRSVYNQADDLMKKLVNSSTSQGLCSKAISTFTEDMKTAIAKMQQVLNGVGHSQTQTIAVRPEKRRLGQGGNIENDLPISLSQRTEILKRRNEKKKRLEIMKQATDISYPNSEVNVCHICFQVDVDLPSDCDEGEDAMLVTRWVRCDSCEQWAHYECGAGRTNRLCIACGEGYYTNNMGEESDHSDE